jgi:outer membrane protein OmpA-like peptidoglycan-associated protein
MTLLSPSRFALTAVAAFVAACASTPPSNASLDDARMAYDQAAADPAVMRSAPVELRKAQEDLARATDAQKRGADKSEIDHDAYLAKKRIEIALASRSIVQSDDAVKDAAQRRDAIVIESRTRDADTQRRIADFAKMDAAQQKAQADQARSIAEANAAAAQNAQAQALAARSEADSLAQQLADLKAKPTDRGMVLTLGDVLFDTGRANLSAGAKAPIDHLAEFLMKNPGRTATIEGYTDSSGGSAMNQALSERRAESVKNALVDRGVEANRLSARGLGEERPVTSNDTAAGRQQNRRVEIVLANAK